MKKRSMIGGDAPRVPLTALLLAAAMVLGGCDATSSSGDAISSAPARPAAASRRAPPADPYWASRFDAISNTATSITGELQFQPSAGDAQASLGFALAGRYETVAQGKALGLDAYSTAESATWSELLGVPMDGIVDVRKVTVEALAAGAPNGGLCGTVPTKWIAIVRRPESEGSDSLMIAAFSGDQAPNPQGDDAALCGTFTYAPH